jgi:hypothetical protein
VTDGIPACVQKFKVVKLHNEIYKRSFSMVLNAGGYASRIDVALNTCMENLLRTMEDFEKIVIDTKILPGIKVLDR